MGMATLRVAVLAYGDLHLIAIRVMAFPSPSRQRTQSILTHSHLGRA